MYMRNCPICNGEMIQKDYGCEGQKCKEIFQNDDGYGVICSTVEDEFPKVKAVLKQRKMEGIHSLTNICGRKKI